VSRWAPGQTEVDGALSSGELQAITGSAAKGDSLLDKAARTLNSAAAVLRSDPDTAYVLAYDAARYSGTALLAQQGLRPTRRGGHHVVETVLRAQFGAGFKKFGPMRRRRNELEYPTIPGEVASHEEARMAIHDAQEILTAARQLLPQLDPY
jgi:uncharacterized protein (UPF0332 family)